MSNFLKIYGLRTSGTNWLQWLIEHNVKDTVVFRNQLAWKHGVPTNQLDWSGDIVEWDDKEALQHQYPDVLDSIKNEKLVNGKTILEMKDEVENAFNSGKLIHCFIIKHPYSWMHSRIHKRDKKLVNEIKDWNEKIKSYFEFDYPAKMIISYEKLNINPQNEIKRLCDEFGLNMKSNWLDTNDNLTHAYSRVGTRERLDENYVEFFRNKFSEGNLNQLDSLLDDECLRLYNTL